MDSLCLTCAGVYSKKILALNCLYNNAKMDFPSLLLLEDVQYLELFAYFKAPQKELIIIIFKQSTATFQIKNQEEGDGL